MDDVQVAERALVGGLVLEPGRFGEVAGWLRPEDFTVPACRLFFERLLELNGAGVTADPARLVDSLRERGELRRDGYPVTTVSRMFDGVPVPALLPVYGRLVVGGAVARQVSAAGRRLEQAGEQSRDPRRLLAGALVARTTLSGVRRRWRQLPGPGDAAAPVTTIALPEPVPGAGSPADRGTARAEFATIGGLLLAPGLAGGVGRWLAPEDFADPGCRLVFDRIGQMTAAGMPVDRVTLTAELCRPGRSGPGRPLGVLLERVEAAASTLGSTGFFARQVLTGSVARQVNAVAGQLIWLGENRPGAPEALLVRAMGALGRARPGARPHPARRLSARAAAPATRGWERGRLATQRPAPGRFRGVG